jgi:hypothetical protein
MSAVVARPPLELPPGFQLLEAPPGLDSMAQACRIAAGHGAGTLVWAPRADVVDFAVVLEPDEPLAAARRAFIAGMVAVAHALAAGMPPEKRIQFEWPATILFDGARLGGARLAWPDGCAETDTPDWLVFSTMLIASKADAGEPGLTPTSTSLEDEHCEFGDPSDLIERFARHLMRTIAEWSDAGFKPVAEAYLSRLSEPEHSGQLAVNGDLVSQSRRRALVAGLERAAWLDSSTGRPLL